MISEEKPLPPVDAPGGILDIWEPTAVHQLTDEHMICVLGVELRVQDCRPAERGGDFFVLEAVKDEGLSPGGKVAGVVVIEVDRNRLVHARSTGGGARSRCHVDSTEPFPDRFC